MSNVSSLHGTAVWHPIYISDASPFILFVLSHANVLCAVEIMLLLKCGSEACARFYSTVCLRFFCEVCVRFRSEVFVRYGSEVCVRSGSEVCPTVEILSFDSQNGMCCPLVRRLFPKWLKTDAFVSQDMGRVLMVHIASQLCSGEKMSFCYTISVGQSFFSLLHRSDC